MTEPEPPENVGPSRQKVVPRSEEMFAGAAMLADDGDFEGAAKLRMAAYQQAIDEGLPGASQRLENYLLAKEMREDAKPEAKRQRRGRSR